jgi:hypothetical protein
MTHNMSMEKLTWMSIYTDLEFDLGTSCKDLNHRSKSRSDSDNPEVPPVPTSPQMPPMPTTQVVADKENKERKQNRKEKKRRRREREREREERKTERYIPLAGHTSGRSKSISLGDYNKKLSIVSIVSIFFSQRRCKAPVLTFLNTFPRLLQL